MNKNFVSAKIHGICVTDKSVDYNGSVSICADLMAQAGIQNHEKVQIVNLNNGNRWETYALEADKGAFALNGGGARLGEHGDVCVVICYSMMETFEPFDVVFTNSDNIVTSKMNYANT